MRWVVAAVTCAAACRGPAAPAPAPPPADEVRLLAARDAEDLTAMRAHAWGLLARAQASWHAWQSSDQVFGLPDRKFRPLQPFRVGDRLEVETLPVMFEVAFDPVAAAHIRKHRLAWRGAVRTMPRVPEFPREAIAAKLVWYPVRRGQRTELPIWDGEPARNDGNPDRTWRRHVVVGDGPGTVPLDAFLYHTLASDDEVAAARAIAHDDAIGKGDAVVLLAMHLSTKEIPDWVWATYWWHDRPDDGPYAAGRPASITGAARHYLADVTLGAGSPKACMNPWLEARFPSGVSSNCVACHRRAALGARDYLPVTHGDLSLDDPYFADKVPTDFVWSLALEAR